MENNTLLIIEENDKQTKETKENPSSRLKLAMASRKLKEEFFRENEINITTELMNEDYENQIDESILEMEQKIGRAYNSDSDSSDDDLSTPSNGNCDEYDIASREKSINLDDDNVTLRSSSPSSSSSYAQQVPSILLPFFERRRLSECIEESETDDDDDDTVEKKKPAQPTIIVTTTNGTTHKVEILPTTVAVAATNRFVVTKAKENEIPNNNSNNIDSSDNNDNSNSSSIQPVSILKKTPSPPSHQKVLLAHSSPKKIRYEAATALKRVTAEKNSHTIHFPCPSGTHDRTNVKSFFSPQGILNRHLDKRYFDTSLVEVRTSQNQLTTSTKSLDGSNTRPLNNDIWIKRNDINQSNSAAVDKISLSSDSDSITSSNRKVDVSLFK